MRAARYYGDRDIRVETVDDPEPGPGEVLLDVAACGICGSDLHLYLHGGAYAEDRLPAVMGHEVGGTVVGTGEGVDVPIGTEVVLNPLIACEDCPRCDEARYNLCEQLRVVGAHRPGGYAETVTAPAGNVVPLPDGLSPTLAAVAEPVTVAYHAVQQSPLRPGDTVAVVGLGPIGLGLVQVAAAADAGRIYASGHREARRALAADCGADFVVDPRETDPVDRVGEDTDGGVDVAFEVAGTESALNDAIEATKPGGHATLVGVYGGPVEFDPMDLVNAERSVNAAAAYVTGPHADREFGAVLRNFEDGTYDPELLVSSRIDLGDVVDAGFEALADSAGPEVKVLVCP